MISLLERYALVECLSILSQLIDSPDSTTQYREAFYSGTWMSLRFKQSPIAKTCLWLPRNQPSMKVRSELKTV